MLGNFTWHFHSAPTNIEFWPEYSSTLRNNYSLKFITEALKFYDCKFKFSRALFKNT